jgi:hypothetical protein
VPIDITVVDGIVAFDDAGFLYGEPSHHQVLDLCFGLFSGAEAWRVPVPLAGVVGLNFGLEAHLCLLAERDCSNTWTLPIAQIGRVKASGCCFVGDDFGHRAMLGKRPASAGLHIAGRSGFLNHSPGAMSREADHGIP